MTCTQMHCSHERVTCPKCRYRDCTHVMDECPKCEIAANRASRIKAASAPYYTVATLVLMAEDEYRRAYPPRRGRR